MSHKKIKSFGKRQKQLLVSVYRHQKVAFDNRVLKVVLTALRKKKLVYFQAGQVVLTKLGKQVVETELKDYLAAKADQAEVVVPKRKSGGESSLNKPELRFLKFISKSPRLITELRGAKHIIPALKDRELLVISENKLWITDRGKALLKSAKKHSEFLNTNEDFSELFISSARIQYQSRTLKKGSKFLTLYMQGLTYQEIGDMHGITRERVRQYLITVPVFHEYLKNLKQHQADRNVIKEEREKERKVRAEQRRKLNNLAVRFPARVNELWDYKKNGSQKPEIVTASSRRVNIWLRCPADGHSWQKKPCHIVQSWRLGTSGCPECAKRTRRKKIVRLPKKLIDRKRKLAQLPEKLIERFPIEVAKYWNYSRNNPLQLDPSILTTLSKKKVWFHCPFDNFDWQANVSAISSEYWKQGRSGCPLCGRGWTVESLLRFIESKQKSS